MGGRSPAFLVRKVFEARGAGTATRRAGLVLGQPVCPRGKKRGLSRGAHMTSDLSVTIGEGIRKRQADDSAALVLCVAHTGSARIVTHVREEDEPRAPILAVLGGLRASFHFTGDVSEVKPSPRPRSCPRGHGAVGPLSQAAMLSHAEQACCSLVFHLSELASWTSRLPASERCSNANPGRWACLDCQLVRRRGGGGWCHPVPRK